MEDLIITKDVVKHFNLQNNSVLVSMEATISSIQLNMLINTDLKDVNNNGALKSFYKELGESPKRICKISNVAKAAYPEVKIGDTVLFNSYANPVAITNKEDEMDLDNVLHNYEIDRKDPKFSANKIGFKYKVRAYYIFNAQEIMLTISK